MTDLEKARKLFPCTCSHKPAFERLKSGRVEDHMPSCQARHWPAIAAALKAEREQEREACLKIFQDCAATPGQGMGFITITAMKLADLIRARGEP